MAPLVERMTKEYGEQLAQTMVAGAKVSAARRELWHGLIRRNPEAAQAYQSRVRDVETDYLESLSESMEFMRHLAEVARECDRAEFADALLAGVAEAELVLMR
jgi:hypothetical protein